MSTFLVPIALAFFRLFVPTMPAEVTVLLPYGVSITVPSGCRVSRADVRAMLSEARGPQLDATAIREDSSGHLVLFALPVREPEEASVEISILPTAVSQVGVSNLSEREIADADAQFRTEIEAAINRLGLTLLEWRGTTRVSLGGRVALVSRYRFHYPNKPPMIMESYGVYLGHRALHIRLQYSENRLPATEEQVKHIRKSIQLSVAAL